MSKRRVFAEKKKLILPFYSAIQNNIKQIASRFDCAIINKNTKKLNYLIGLGKDKLENLEKNNIVYQIDCKNCDASYIGQSLRKLRFRVNEHRRAVNKKNISSALAKHVLETGHSINFKKPKILDSENNLQLRLFSEMLNIHYQKNNINYMKDTQFLKNIYKYTIDRLK